MYVVARVRKTSRQLGEPVGPQHVARTFVPYDARDLTEEAAREFAANLNYRYTPHIHGRTYVAVPAEPVPGGNKFRNLAS